MVLEPNMYRFVMLAACNSLVSQRFDLEEHLQLSAHVIN